MLQMSSDTNSRYKFFARPNQKHKLKPYMNTTAVSYAAFIGIDWAGQKHDLWLQPSDGATPEHSILEQTPAAIQNWLNQLRQRFGGQTNPCASTQNPPRLLESDNPTAGRPTTAR